MHSLRVRSLSVRALRNLVAVDLEPDARLNVISGGNGQGKTSLLEALYLVATTRSFRTSKLGELIPMSTEQALSVRAVVEEGETVHEQSVGILGRQRRVRIDGQAARGMAAYAARTPVVVFSPSEMAVSMGPGLHRRKLLDRIALYATRGVVTEVEAYTRALRERQRSLDLRGGASVDLPVWEELLSRHGIALMQARMVAATRVAESARAAFARIAAPGLEADLVYAPGAPLDKEAYLRALAASRARDLVRGSASVGPHRDDLLITLGGAPARRVGSQGQHRALVLALKIAEIEVIAASRHARPILLLDDVSSELDRASTRSLFELLEEQEGQVFLTTTRADLLQDFQGLQEKPRRDFSIVGGVVTSRQGR